MYYIYTLICVYIYTHKCILVQTRTYPNKDAQGKFRNYLQVLHPTLNKLKQADQVAVPANIRYLMFFRGYKLINLP